MAKTPRISPAVSAVKASDMNPVGMVVSAMLTEAQFQALNGTSWVLMDGRSIAGSKYAQITGTTTLPDARGMVLRGKNNGRTDGSQNPDGDSALGTFQADQFGSHVHSLYGADGGVSGGGGKYNSSITYNMGTSGMAAAGGNETRMKNITVNHFIKINP